MKMFGGIDKFSLLSVPFFILAANIMKNGGIGRRIVDWAASMVGDTTGGLAFTTEIASMFFGAVSGLLSVHGRRDRRSSLSGLRKRITPRASLSV